LKIERSIEQLLELLDSNDSVVQEQALRAVGALCSSNEDLTLKRRIATPEMINRLQKLLGSTNPMLQASAAMTIGYLGAHNEKLQKDVVESGILRTLVQLLHNPSQRVQHATSRAIRLLAENSAYMQHMFTEGLSVGALCQLLLSPNSIVVMEAMGALSETVRNDAKLQRLVVSSVGPLVINNALNSESRRARIYAGSLLLSIVKGNPYLKTELEAETLYANMARMSKSTNPTLRALGGDLLKAFRGTSGLEEEAYTPAYIKKIPNRALEGVRVDARDVTQFLSTATADSMVPPMSFAAGVRVNPHPPGGNPRGIAPPRTVYDAESGEPREENPVLAAQRESDAFIERFMRHRPTGMT